MTSETTTVVGGDNQIRLGAHGIPSTRYQGSKRKILPWLWQKLSNYDFVSVLDVFGGTGVVSYLFKQAGKRVTYNDYLHWNHCLGVALIENNKTRLSGSEIDMLTQPVSRRDRGFVSRTFKDIYFTEQENLWIDAIFTRSHQLKGTKAEVRYKRACTMYALFQTCLVKRPFNMFHRRNLSIRQADVKRSFGNKTTWDTPFAAHFREFSEELGRCIFQGLEHCQAMNHDALEIPDSAYDLLYLDPPYLHSGPRAETADYLHCYHFLEGLARYTEWPQLINYSSRLRSFSDTIPNPWADPTRSRHAFSALIDKFPRSIIAISYKKFGQPSIDTLARLLRKRGRTVHIHTKHYKYALNRQNGSAELNRECLIIGE